MKHKNRSTRGKSARSRGHAFEVYIVNLLKEHGYQATSARQASRRLDEQGIDIETDAPFNIQCKYVEALSPGAHDLIKGMPQHKDRVNILAHKRAQKGTIISMSLQDFADLLLYKKPALSEGNMGMPFDDAHKRYLPGHGWQEEEPEDKPEYKTLGHLSKGMGK